ncbi:hypothetical protein [Scandinavium goeteborgense]|uniref:hypothetical protein n=1 Tax=Scandinavium goeteborgense TaxID=1851514 RepID=UPI000F6925FD|nr:hypothetical protein [Scandinavium goeteborgense]QKN82221.1 hypothetical protein A8O29_013340 [Scandinavium goeteborgense]
MTTKQNAIDLAQTARCEAANTAKRTIAAIINNWNECVKQAGFMGVFDFPTTGYTRKAQLIADLERCAAQLDDYVEPSNYMATTTVEQHAADIDAILSGTLTAEHKAQIDFFAANDHAARCLLIEAAHAEAIGMDAELNEALMALSTPLISAGWHLHSPTIAAQALRMAHAKALDMNAEWDERGAVLNDRAFIAYWGCNEDAKWLQAARMWNAMRDEALCMNSAYPTSTGQGVSHNTKAHSAPLSLLGNGLLDGGVRSHVVPLLCVVLAVPGLKSLI